MRGIKLAKRSLVLSVVAILGLGTSAVLAAGSMTAAPFMLHDHDTIVFYGDSITEQNKYTQFVELYAITRFPRWQLRFVTSGVGGDKVSGGGGGPVETRLSRDIVAYRPDVVTVMLGMNDGLYQAPSEAVTSAYTSGYDHLLGAVKQALPQVRITTIGPSAFDDVTRPLWFAGGYNGVMKSFAALDAQLAAKHGGTSVDFNAPTVAALKQAQRLDPLVARLLIPDRVHPEDVIHWIMAEALIKGWHGPDIVSSLVLGAGTGTVTSSNNITITGLRKTPGGLVWQSTENALPLPIDESNETFATLLKISDLQTTLNREQLVVTGLQPRRYTLKIDDKPVATWTGAELAAGVNLARVHTPMRDQAQRIAWALRDRIQNHYVRLRAQINGLPAETYQAYDRLDRKLDDQIHRDAVPAPHNFELTASN